MRLFSIRALRNQGSLDPSHPPRREKEHQIIILAQGRGSLWVDGAEQEVEAPVAILVSKSKQHAFHPGEDAEGWSLTFQDTLFPMHFRLLYARIFKASSVSLAVPSFRRRVLSLVQCLEDIHLLGFKEEQRAIPYLLYGLLQLLLVPIGRFVSRETVPASAQFTLFVHFLQLIDQYGLDVASVPFYTERLQVSPQRLREACRIHAGQSPHAVLEEMRMTEAKRLMLDSDSTIKQIANVLGYHDPAYFSRAFRSGGTG